MDYYNAIAKTDYGAAITYHEISRVKAFTDNIKDRVSVKIIYFYRLPFRTAKKGKYCGSWSPARGFDFSFSR